MFLFKFRAFISLLLLVFISGCAAVPGIGAAVCATSGCDSFGNLRYYPSSSIDNLLAGFDVQVIEFIDSRPTKTRQIGSERALGDESYRWWVNEDVAAVLIRFYSEAFHKSGASINPKSDYKLLINLRHLWQTTPWGQIDAVVEVSLLKAQGDGVVYKDVFHGPVSDMGVYVRKGSSGDYEYYLKSRPDIPAFPKIENIKRMSQMLYVNETVSVALSEAVDLSIKALSKLNVFPLRGK